MTPKTQRLTVLTTCARGNLMRIPLSLPAAERRRELRFEIAYRFVT